MTGGPEGRSFKSRARSPSDEEIREAAARDLEALKGDKQFRPSAPPTVARASSATSDAVAESAMPAAQESMKAAESDESSAGAKRQRNTSEAVRKADMRMVHVRLSEELHRDFRVAASLRGTSAQALLEDFVKKFVAANRGSWQ